MATPTEELQIAVVNRLLADLSVAAIVGTRIYDGPPKEPQYPYLSLGPQDAVFEDMDDVDGIEITMQVDCWSRDGNRLWPTRNLAHVVSRALHHAKLELPTHAVAWIEVEQTRAFMDADQETSHGVIVLTAMVEER